MDLNAVVAMTLQTMQEFVQMSHCRALTEYEMLAYEAACRLVQKYMQFQECIIKKEMNDYLQANPDVEE